MHGSASARSKDFSSSVHSTVSWPRLKQSRDAYRIRCFFGPVGAASTQHLSCGVSRSQSVRNSARHGTEHQLDCEFGWATNRRSRVEGSKRGRQTFLGSAALHRPPDELGRHPIARSLEDADTKTRR